MALIEAVLDGRLPTSDLYHDRLATCVGCLACEAACASKVPVTAIIHAAREEAVRERGRSVIEEVIRTSLAHRGLLQAFSWLAPTALHFGKGSVRGRSLQNAPRKLRSGGRKGPRGFVALFAGCAIRSMRQDIGHDVIEVLEALGYGVVIPSGLECCGRPLLSLGDAKAAKELAERNAEILSGSGADAVVTACASCGLTLKKEYPGLLEGRGAVLIPVLDIHELLDREADRLRLLVPLPLTATWHEPCHLGRGQGLGGTAKRALHAIPGLSIVDMERPDRCCGFGGVMRATHPGMSKAIGSDKARDILQTGAEAVVTGCPGCMMQIADSLRREGAPMPVLHTVQVIAAALCAAGQGDTVTGRHEAEPVTAGFSLRKKR